MLRERLVEGTGYHGAVHLGMMMRGENVASMFREVEGSCLSLRPTRSAIGRDLLGGLPVPKSLSVAQKRARRFHHRRGSGALRASALTWIA